MSDIVPAGLSFMVNTFRLGTDELAGSFMLAVEKPTLAADVAALVEHRSAALVEKDAPRGTHQVITLNVMTPDHRGGCSWQCLTVLKPVAREAFAKAVGHVAADMVLHCIRCFVADMPAPAEPRVVN